MGRGRAMGRGVEGEGEGDLIFNSMGQRMLEHSAWIRRLWVRVPLRLRHFLSQKLWHFNKNIRSNVEMSVVVRGQLLFQMFTLLEKYLYRPSEHWKTCDCKCLSLITPMVTAFSMNPKVGGRVPLRSRNFLFQKRSHFYKNICSCVENECCFPRAVNISNVNFTSKNTYIQAIGWSVRNTWRAPNINVRGSIFSGMLALPSNISHHPIAYVVFEIRWPLRVSGAVMSSNS